MCYPLRARHAVRTLLVLGYVRRSKADMRSAYCYPAAALCLLPLEVLQWLFMWLTRPPWSALWLYPEVYSGDAFYGASPSHLLNS